MTPLLIPPAPITRPVADVALVCEGGGMRAAYTAAFIEAFLMAGIAFPWVGGISAGATHTTNMVARDPWRTRAAFVDVAADPEIGGWGSFLRGRGYFDSHYLYQRTPRPDGSLPFDWESFSTSASTACIGAFNCATGEQHYWTQAEMGSLEDLLVRAQASASMPLLMPVTWIDGQPFYDGALGPTGGFATDAAQAAGYERMLVLSTRPRGYRKAAPRLSSAQRALLRRYPATGQAVLERHRRYNATLDSLEAMQDQGRVYIVYPQQMDIANGELRYDRLVTAYELGRRQSEAELPAILRFLGL